MEIHWWFTMFKQHEKHIVNYFSLILDRSIAFKVTYITLWIWWFESFLWNLSNCVCLYAFLLFLLDPETLNLDSLSKEGLLLSLPPKQALQGGLIPLNLALTLRALPDLYVKTAVWGGVCVGRRIKGEASCCSLNFPHTMTCGLRFKPLKNI